MKKPTYLFSRGERALLVEVYFPKKVVFQGAIFRALEEGHSEELVKKYLKERVDLLLTELASYPHLFDPYQYETPPVRRIKVFRPSTAEARKRFDMYVSRFRGWSMYEVDGMFFRGEKVYEERTQVIRLMFRFASRYTAVARKWEAQDVLRSILFFVIRARGLIFGETLWDEVHKQEFLKSHEWVDPRKKRFTEEYYSRIARETIRWIDDCALFIFGYLVHEFSQEVLERRRIEEEIWVTAIVGITLNVIRRSKEKTLVIEKEDV